MKGGGTMKGNLEKAGQVHGGGGGAMKGNLEKGGQVHG